MHANQATYANATGSAPQIAREIPDQLQRLRETIGELGRRSEVLIARTESVRRIPVPEPVGNESRTAAPTRAIPQTPIGTVLDEMTRELEHQIRTVNFAIDTVELA